MTQSTIAAFVGIDWADQQHRVCLSAADSNEPEELSLRQSPEAIGAFVNDLRTRFQGRPVAIGLEQSRGALLYALMAHDFLRLYPINPAVAQHYRRSFYPSGAKSDPSDARVLWDLLRHRHAQLRPLAPSDPITRELTLLCEHRRSLVGQQTACVQRLRAALKNYFPQALDWCGTDLASQLTVDFLQRWPTLAAVQRAKPATLRQFYFRHHVRRPQRIEERVPQIQQAQPLVQDQALINAYSLQVRTLVAQLRILRAGIAQYDQHIAALFATHPERPFWQSWPGAGPCLAPRLAAALGTDRERFPTAQSIQMLSGVAPVTISSGKSQRVRRRYACAKFMLQSLHEYARCSLLFCAWAQAYYQAQRAQGKGHNAAVRALAFKWLRIIWRCWQNRQPYDPDRYARALHRTGSPLAKVVPLPAEAT